MFLRYTPVHSPSSLSFFHGSSCICFSFVIFRLFLPLFVLKYVFLPPFSILFFLSFFWEIFCNFFSSLHFGELVVFPVTSHFFWSSHIRVQVIFFIFVFWFFFVALVNQVCARQLLSLLSTFMFNWFTVSFILVIITPYEFPSTSLLVISTYHTQVPHKLLFSLVYLPFISHSRIFFKCKLVFVYLSCIVHLYHFFGIIFVLQLYRSLHLASLLLF